MPKRISRIAALTSTAMIGLAAVTSFAGGAEADQGARIENNASMPSPTLGRTIPYSIYIPADALSHGHRLPVLYLLHGHGDDHKAWLDKGGIAEILDRDIASGAVQPMIVVMPAAGNSWYVDDAEPDRYGRVSQALTNELIFGIEARYPAARCREARAVGGLSMGGYGAMLYALLRPELYVAAISLSGSLFSELPDDIERRRTTYERLYDGVFGRPFDGSKFISWNTFELLKKVRDQRLPAVWLAAGENDYPSILEGTRRMQDALRTHGQRSELHIAPGGHTWDLWRAGLEPALRWLSRQLTPACGAADASR